MTDRGSDSLSWDAENRLTSATVDSATTDFAYNGDGLRDSLTYDSNTTTFTWDVNASVPQVLDDGDFRYVYGLGRIAEVDGSDNAHYYLADGLGSTIALTDDSGTVENTYEYDPFGAVSASTGSQDNAFTFTGEQTDASTSLEYLRARYYDPHTGRFVSRDFMASFPWWIDHYFVYVGNDPVALIDPSGTARRSDGPARSNEEFNRKCQMPFERCLAAGERSPNWMRWEVHQLCDALFFRCRQAILQGEEFDWNRELRRFFDAEERPGFSIFRILPPITGSGGLLDKSNKEGGLFSSGCGSS